jgi:hypothetical protein
MICFIYFSLGFSNLITREFKKNSKQKNIIPINNILYKKINFPQLVNILQNTLICDGDWKAIKKEKKKDVFSIYTKLIHGVELIPYILLRNPQLSFD